MDKKARRCWMCGQHYFWCNTCHDFNPEETWKYLYHDENCLEVSKIWYAYRGNEITAEEAKKQMDQYPETIEMIMENDSVPAKEIQAIYKMFESKQVEEPKVEVVEEQVATEEQPQVKQQTTAKKENSRPRNVNRSTSKNKK